MHPLLRLAASQPQWLAEHAEAYADLVADEFGSAAQALHRRAVLTVIALCSAVLAAALAGVAALLWAALPAEAVRAPWVLVAVPLLPAALAAGCLLAIGATSGGAAFATLRQQLRADFVLLREMTAR